MSSGPPSPQLSEGKHSQVTQRPTATGRIGLKTANILFLVFLQEYPRKLTHLRLSAYLSQKNLLLEKFLK
jgi:hypothetical protein